MEKQLLIVGIDPGATLGYAVLDLEGNPLKIASSKQLNINSLIKRILEIGKPIIAAADVSPAPQSVQRFATSVGCKLLYPYHDLSIKEKTELTKQFREEIKNTHIRDALAAALYAFKTINPLLKKIDNRLKQFNKQHLAQQVKELVILQDIPISRALELAEQPAEKIPKAVITLEKEIPEDVTRQQQKIKSLKHEITMLQAKNAQLRAELSALSAEHARILEKLKYATAEEKIRILIANKDRTISSMNKKILELNEKIKAAQHEIALLNDFLADASQNYLLKKLPNLSFNEFESRNRILKIRENDILLVDDADISSEKTIAALKDKNLTIIYRKASQHTRSTKPFAFISAQNLEIKEDEYFAAVSKAQLDAARPKDILSKIIAEYRKERKK